MDLSRVLFTIIFVASILFFAWNVFRLFALMCLGKWENRFDHLGARLKNMLVYAFGQVRVVRTKYGFNHFLIFWGFIVMLAVNFQFLLQGIFPDFSFAFLGTPIYGTLLFFTDVMSMVVLAAVVAAVARRLFFRPPHIELSGDAFFILGMIAALMVFYFSYHAAEIALGIEALGGWMPLSAAFANPIEGMTPAQLHTIAEVSWWIHALVLLVFLNYLPYSKHLHVITAIPNCFFRGFDFPKTVPTMDFELGNNFGISKINQFTWKDILDFYSCTECGRCQEACPAHNTDKPLNPKEIIHQGKYNLFANAPVLRKDMAFDSIETAPDDVNPSYPIIGGEDRKKSVDIEALWACTTCGACMEHCPVFIEHVPKIIEMRQHLVMEKAEFPEELTPFFENVEQRSNPWGIPPTDREKWAEGLDIKKLHEGAQVDYLYYVGCSGAYDSRSQSIARSMAKILNAAGISWGILGTEEKCCGDSARRIGNEYVYAQLAKDNIETLDKYRVKKIIVSCPHGYSTLKNDYKQYGGDYEVIHHSEFIQQLIREGKLELSPNKIGKVVFHDSCFLGRYNEIYDPPRSIVQAATGEEPLEMERCRNNSFCCGAGGGRMWMEELIGGRIFLDRTREALKTDANTIAVSCPFCMTMFEDGIKEENKENEVKVQDIAEMVAKALKQ